jgi:cytochrome c5
MPIRTTPDYLHGLALALAVLPCLFFSAAHAQAPANGASVYQAKCSLCHDSGAGAAPRITHPEEWTARLNQPRAALQEVAIKGKPGTAMAARGGFAELSDADVRAAVDFMLARLEYKEQANVAAASPYAPAAASMAQPAAASAGPVDDAAITEKVRAAYAASNGAVSTRVQVESNGGVVTLKGMVRDNEAVKRAEALARAVPGVKNVDNKLVSAAVFQWD